ncbi:MAG: 50S ribosomal protein L11 [archaeon]
MMTQTIKLLVDAGKATAGPPLGPALGPLGINTIKVVEEINLKTKDLNGMQIPVIVHIDTKTKSFTIEVGAPQTSALIKKELNVKTATGKVNTEVTGTLSFDQLLKVTKAKYPQLIARDMKNGLREVLGTCRSMGVNVDNKTPAEILAKLNKGELIN